MSKGNQPRRIKIDPIPGLAGYKLSKMVNEIDFCRPNSRGQLRSGATTKAVLRALCDRYPNDWASVRTDAKKVGISERQFQYELRRLENLHRLIVPIGNNRGGHHKNTTQYFTLDRKILNIVQTKRLFELWERVTSQQGRVQSHQGASDVSGEATGAISDRDGCNLRPENEGTGAMPCTQREQFFKRTEEKKKKEETPSFYSNKNGPSPSAQNGQGEHNPERAALACQYFVWLFETYTGLSFGTKNKAAIHSFIVSGNYSLEVLQLGTARILDDPSLDLTSPFTHADNRLVGSLAENCESARQHLEKLERLKKLAVIQEHRARKEAERELAEGRKQDDFNREALAELIGEPAAVSV